MHDTKVVYIIVYKADGDDLHLSTRYIGPFESFDDAYDDLENYPAPINAGHKFIQHLEMPQYKAEPNLDAQAAYDAEWGTDNGGLYDPMQTER